MVDNVICIEIIVLGFIAYIYRVANAPAMKHFFLYLMAAAYVVAGLNHFFNPRFYVRIMPAWLPWHTQLVAISGLCEIAGGLMLLLPATRVAGAWFLIAILIAVFPANIQMTVNFAQRHNPYLWVTILRLPLQLVLIWWAWLYTK